MATAAKQKTEDTATDDAVVDGYVLGEQIGFILRRATQRHKGIFADLIDPPLTVTQFAAMAKLYELESCTQNRLGRHTALDAATIKGVVDRLTSRGFTRTWPDPTDARRFLVGLTDEGLEVIRRAIPLGVEITESTLEPLDQVERKTLIALLEKIC